MKRYLISTVAVLVVLAVVLAAFGQQERSRQTGRQTDRQGGRPGGGSGRGGFMSSEERQKAIKAIEEQLAMLKKEVEVPRPEGGFQNLSDEERTKFRQSMTKVFQERQKAIDIIVAQVARLQGRRQPQAEGAKFFIVSTSDLKPIQDSAVKEKAKETSQMLEGLIARGSGQMRFGRPGSGQRPQGGQRGGQRDGQRGGQRERGAQR